MDKGAASLSESLPTMATLQTLQLERNKITDVGAMLLAKASRNLTKIQNLYLHLNNVTIYGKQSLRNFTFVRLECNNCECCAPSGCDDVCKDLMYTKVILGKTCITGSGRCKHFHSTTRHVCCHCDSVC